MSHSQFHCTGRAYLDMHGLIFETSICYWQDQPGRGASTRSRACRESGAGRRGHGRGTRAGRPARRGSQGGGGVAGGRSPEEKKKKKIYPFSLQNIKE